MQRPYAPFQHNLDGADHARAFRVTDAGTNNVSVAAGRVRIDQTVTNYATATALGPLANGTNFVYIDNGGNITSNLGGPYPAQSIPLARVVVAGGDVTGITDDRCLFPLDSGAQHIRNAVGGFWEYSDMLEWVSVGHAGILSAAAGGVAAAWTDYTSQASHPGIWQAGTGTTNAGHTRLTSQQDGITFSNGRIRFGTWIRTLGFVSSAAQRFQLYMGIIDNIDPGAVTDGIQIRYRDDINGGKWQGRVTNGGGNTDLDLGVLVAINTWYFLEIEINAAGNSVEFFIDGASIGTIASGPAANSTAEIRTGILKSIGNTARYAVWDAYYLDGELAVAR